MTSLTKETKTKDDGGVRPMDLDNFQDNQLAEMVLAYMKGKGKGGKGGRGKVEGEKGGRWKR